jgi:hypothetical protein
VVMYFTKHFTKQHAAQSEAAPGYSVASV